jgi:hypothetical protein
MSDIVARMRCRTLMLNCGNGDVRDLPDEDCLEAADEIERLRAREARLREALKEFLEYADVEATPLWVRNFARVALAWEEEK